MASFDRKPRAIVCYLCGRQYGTTSIQARDCKRRRRSCVKLQLHRCMQIHLKSCQTKWLSEEALKPRSQQRPLPAPPTEFGALLSGDRPGTAGGAPSAAAIDALNEAAFHSYKDALAKCEHCGRSFNADRLVIHHRSCTADNPARRVGERLPGGGGMPTGAGRAEAEMDAPADADEDVPRRSASRSATRPGRPGTAPTAAAASHSSASGELTLPQALYPQSPARPATAATGIPQLSSMRSTVPVGTPTPSLTGVSPLQRRSVGLPTIAPAAAGGTVSRSSATPSREELASRVTALRAKMQDMAREFERAMAEVTREMAELAEAVQAMPEDASGR